MVRCLEALFACFFPAVLWAIHLEQEQISVTMQPLQGSSAKFTCRVFGGSDSTYIHWYRARAGEAPHRLLHLTLSGSKLNREAGFSNDKFSAYGTQNISNLLVHKLEKTDKGHYYCATHGEAAKIFGTGTKLVVTETEAKLDSKKVQVLPPFAEKDGKVTHICLIEDFYPNVIKVTWKDDKENAEKNAVLGEIWPPDDNRQSYSISSWLTVDKNSNKNYRCHYQHESKADSVPTASPGTSIAPQSTADCTNRLFIERFMHRTAYLIYIVLLLKSTMYYVIVLFFMYRMQSPIKRQGKKP